MRARVLLGVLGLLPSTGCGGTATRSDDERNSEGVTSSATPSAISVSTGAGGSGTAGSSAAGSHTGTTGTDGSNVGGAVGSSAGGSGAVGGTAGDSSTDGPAQIANEREREILAPLWIDAATLAEASGDELLELARGIALARGYVNCRCFVSPEGPPEDIEMLLADCAVWEAWPHVFGEEPDFRCMRELNEGVAGLDEYIRCEAGRAQRDTSRWLPMCTDLGELPPELEGPAECASPPGYADLEETCREAYYCADGTLNAGGRCDGVPTCSVSEDEFQCFDEVGQDAVLCPDGTLVVPTLLCSSECGLSLEPPVCDLANPYGFVCPDGTELHAYDVCDRTDDCAAGEDEAICFR